LSSADLDLVVLAHSAPLDTSRMRDG